MTPAGDLTHKPGMCADQELNQPPLGSQDDAQPTEPYHSAIFTWIYLNIKLY